MYKGSICDIQGLMVGHAQNEEARTGCTVLWAQDGFVAGVDVRGAAPGTRETDLLKSENMMPRINAIVLCGGSAFGLDACSGVMHALEERGVGFDVGLTKVPIVCGAVLFDLGVGDAFTRPDAQTGRQALDNTTRVPAWGHVGAGTGATVGKLLLQSVPGAQPKRSGIGTASIRLPGGGTVAAMIAVNAAGDVYNPATGECVACAELNGKKLPAMSLLGSTESLGAMFGQNTTIGVVATDVKLSKVECNRLATVAHDGYALAIRPVHTSADGDTLFAISHGEYECDPIVLQAAATEVVARAIQNAVTEPKEE